MDKEAKKFIAILSVAITIFVIVLRLLFGFDLSGFEIHKGIKLN